MAPFFQTARQYVLHSLRADILTGRYATGTHLRQEEVAKRLGVSTTPVREAFRDLLADGLVASDPHKGVITRGLKVNDVREIYELRMMLEPHLAERAVRRVTAAQLVNAENCHQTMCATTDPEAWALINEDFHGHFVATEEKSRLFDIVCSLSRAARPYVVLSMHVQPEIIDSNNADHASLLRAYKDRDSAAVIVNTREHLANTLDAIVRCADQWTHPIARAL